jgi:hypothetical protein
MMKSLRFIAALGLLVPFGIAGVTSAIAGNASVVVTNTTSYTMSEFYTSPSDASAWDTTNNLITGQTILPGQTTTINISNVNGNGDGDSTCNYDLMAVLYGAAQFAYKYQVDVCNEASWTITQ